MKFMITLALVIAFLVSISLVIGVFICWIKWVNKNDSDD